MEKPRRLAAADRQSLRREMALSCPGHENRTKSEGVPWFLWDPDLDNFFKNKLISSWTKFTSLGLRKHNLLSHELQNLEHEPTKNGPDERLWCEHHPLATQLAVTRAASKDGVRALLVKRFLRAMYGVFRRRRSVPRCVVPCQASEIAVAALCPHYC